MNWRVSPQSNGRAGSLTAIWEVDWRKSAAQPGVLVFHFIFFFSKPNEKIMSGTYYFKLLFPSTSLNRILFDGEEKNLPRIVKGLGKSGSLIKRDFNFVFFTMKHLCKVDLLQVVPEASKQTACNYN